MNEEFERLMIAHFGEKVESVLCGFDEDDGYPDETINSMWIGFKLGRVGL